MPSLRIRRFGGLNTEIAARNSPKDVAQIAHNCLLWDGSLRPLAKWIPLSTLAYDQYSIHVDTDDKTILFSPFVDSQFLLDAVFPPSTKIGLAAFPYATHRSNIGYVNNLVATGTSFEVGVPPVTMDAGLSSVVFSSGYKSIKPENRLYAVSAIRNNGVGLEEGTLTLVPNQSTQTITYQGDPANITIKVADSQAHERSGVRLYRSISAMDNPVTPHNRLDTEWYLIHEFPATANPTIDGYYYFNDDGSVTDKPLDLYLAKHFYRPAGFNYTNFKLSEGGWFAAATANGDIAISERYLYHAWPTESYLKIAEQVTDMAFHYDTLYIGTKNRPYSVAVAVGEALGTQLGAVPFTSNYECLVGTMDVSASGAMYTTNAGVVGLSKEGERLLSAGIASGVRALFHAEYVDNAAVLTPPIQRMATSATTGGSLAAATRYYVVTALNSLGETVASNEQTVVNTGSTSVNRVSWEHVFQATKIRVYRGTVSGSENQYVEFTSSTTSVDLFIDDGTVTFTSGSPPGTNTAINPTIKCKDLNFRDTTYGAYFNGKYFGFADILRDDGKYLNLGFIFDTGSTLDGEHPLQKLVTFDGPPARTIGHAISSSGIDVLTAIPNPDLLVDAQNKNFVYTMPFPNTKEGGDYTAAPKQCYQWKSKKFVFPGKMCMSALKVVHDCDGDLRIKVYVDCCCRYEVSVVDCNPFRLPPNLVGVEWEVELHGTATVHEVHMASSMRELIEDEQGAFQ